MFDVFAPGICSSDFLRYSSNRIGRVCKVSFVSCSEEKENCFNRCFGDDLCLKTVLKVTVTVHEKDVSLTALIGKQLIFVINFYLKILK